MDPSSKIPSFKHTDVFIGYFPRAETLPENHSGVNQHISCEPAIDQIRCDKIAADVVFCKKNEFVLLDHC